MKAINNEIIDINCYTLPFEGEKHFATVIMLPFREDVWYKKALPARENFKEVIFQIAEYETVILIIDPSIDEKIVHEFERENIIIYRIKYDDSWARDTSPIFLINRDEDKIVGVDFGFNAYGGKDHGLYYPYDNDDNFAKNLLLELCIPSFKRKDFVLEGGSICCDGKGSLLTTRECLLSPDRNPSMSEEEIGAYLKKSLNIKRVLFLPYGVEDDETGGHVDNVCCFLDDKTILLAYEEDENLPQHERSVANYDYLKSLKTLDGESYNIIKMPFPKKMYIKEEETEDLLIKDDSKKRIKDSPLAGSYVNFYMSEKFIVLPQFLDENDKEAVKILQDFYGDAKKIIPVYSRDILLGGGNIHCITMQIPYSSSLSYIMEARNDK